MKNPRRSVLGAVLLLATAGVTFNQNEETRDQNQFPAENNKNKEPSMKTQEQVKLLLEIFRAIERRDNQRVAELFDPNFEIHWPPSLPYGGTFRGLNPRANGWVETWAPLQPTEAERRMDPRVVAASEDEVVVLWRQRGVSPAGERLDSEVLGLYQVRQGKLVRAQMFYFDTAAVARFLANARSPSSGTESMTSDR